MIEIINEHNQDIKIKYSILDNEPTTSCHNCREWIHHYCVSVEMNYGFEDEKKLILCPGCFIVLYKSILNNCRVIIER